MVQGAVGYTPARALEGSTDRVARLSVTELHGDPKKVARYEVTEFAARTRGTSALPMLPFGVRRRTDHDLRVNPIKGKESARIASTGVSDCAERSGGLANARGDP